MRARRARLERRELELRRDSRVPWRFLGLAALLPALFSGTRNDAREDWLAPFVLLPVGRHDSLTDG